jgi:hypothetical protein
MGFIAQAKYEEAIRRKQLAIERVYLQQQMRQEFDPYQQVLAPPPPPLQSLRKRNKRLLLCGN